MTKKNVPAHRASPAQSPVPRRRPAYTHPTCTQAETSNDLTRWAHRASPCVTEADAAFWRAYCSLLAAASSVLGQALLLGIARAPPPLPSPRAARACPRGRRSAFVMRRGVLPWLFWGIAPAQACDYLPVPSSTRESLTEADASSPPRDVRCV